MENKSSDFMDGILCYMSKSVERDKLKEEIGELKDWDDGYLAFSNLEKRLKDLRNLDIDALSGKVNGIVEDAEGYLMEADLWRSKDDGWEKIYEEIYVEREDGRFFVERWTLMINESQKDKVDGKGYFCFWRRMNPLIHKPSLDKHLFSEDELGAIEIIVPEARLHIFMSERKKG